MLYKILKPLFWLVFHTLFRVHASGMENMDNDEAYLICSNHISLVDFAFIGTSIKQSISFLGKSEISRFKPIGAIIKSLGFIPINRGKSDLNAIRNVILTVEKGRSVLLFPQGTRKRGIKVSQTTAKNGVALMQRKANCKVLPVSVTTSDMRVHIFSKVYVKFGSPIDQSEFVGLDDKASANKIFDEIIKLSEDCR